MWNETVGILNRADESGGQNVLSRMLLHVIAPPGNVDLTADTTSRGQVFYRSFEIMDDSSVFGIGDFGDAVFRCTRSDPARVVDLPAASGIKRSTVESDRWPRAFGDVANLAFKFVEKRVVIVEPVGHCILILFEPVL